MPSIAAWINRFRPGVVLTDPPVEQVQRAHGDRQHVVEVVRDAACQLPDSLHLLRLAERVFSARQRLGLLVFGRDVAGRAVKLAFLGHRHPRQPHVIAVLLAVAVFKQKDGIAALDLFESRIAAVQVVGMDEIGIGRADQVFVGPAQDFRPGPG